jgi:hypothetical protein
MHNLIKYYKEDNMAFNFFDLASNMHINFDMLQQMEVEASGSKKRKQEKVDAQEVSPFKTQRSNPEELQQKLFRLILTQKEEAFLKELPNADDSLRKYCFNIAKATAPTIALAILTQTPNLLPQEDQGRSLVAVCSYPQPNNALIQELLKQNISEQHLKLSLEVLVKNRSSMELIQQILPRLTDISSLQGLIKTSFSFNFLDIIPHILSSPLCDNALKIEALNLSIQRRASPVFQQILTEHRAAFSPNDLQRALNLAASRGSTEIVTRLLAEGIPHDADERGSLINLALNSALLQPADQREAYLETVRALVANGPIYQSAAARALMQTPDWIELTAILESATILADPVIHFGPIAPGVTFALNLEDVAANPSTYLQKVINEGFPQSITLLNVDGRQTGVVDAGGVRKGFVTTLFKALQNQLNIQPEGLPSLEKELKDFQQRQELYRNIGGFLSRLVEANQRVVDPFLIGAFFSPEFYQILKLAAQGPNPRDLHLAIANFLTVRTPDLQILKDLIDNPQNHEASKAYGVALLGIDDWSIEQHATNILPAVQDHIESFVTPVRCLLEGLSGELRRKVCAEPASSIAELFQGPPLTKQHLKDSLRIEGRATELLQQQMTWIKEKIDFSDLEWSKRFLKWATERECIPLGIIIGLQATHGNLQPHTCGNLIDLPAALNNKDDFLAALDAVLDAPLNRA